MSGTWFGYALARVSGVTRAGCAGGQCGTAGYRSGHRLASGPRGFAGMSSCCDKVGWVTPVGCSKSPTVRSCWANWHSQSKRSALPSSGRCHHLRSVLTHHLQINGGRRAGPSIVGIMAKGKQSKSTYLKAQAKYPQARPCIIHD